MEAESKAMAKQQTENYSMLNFEHWDLAGQNQAEQDDFFSSMQEGFGAGFDGFDLFQGFQDENPFNGSNLGPSFHSPP